MLRSGRRWAEIQETLARAERWLLPGACLLCGETIGGDAAGGRTVRRSVGQGAVDPLVCPPCLNRFSSLPHPQCERCGQPLSPGIACRLCAEWPQGFGGVRSAVWLDEPARQAVHRLKYGGWLRIAESLGEVMVTRLPGLGRSGRPVLVPIPLSAARERARGYNQAAVLAQALARRTGLSVFPVLRRQRDTGTQTALTPEERRANLAGAFIPAGRPPPHVLLVDDVFTTGATLAEAAQALL